MEAKVKTWHTNFMVMESWSTNNNLERRAVWQNSHLREIPEIKTTISKLDFLETQPIARISFS